MRGRALAVAYWKLAERAPLTARCAAPSRPAAVHRCAVDTAAALAPASSAGPNRSIPESGVERLVRSAPDLHADDRTQIACGARGGVFNPKRTSTMKRILKILGLAGSACAAISGHATVPDTGTAAGTEIVNTAQANYAVNGSQAAPVDGEVTLKVDELIQIEITAPTSTIVEPGDTAQTLIFTVTNTGNGPEDFDIGTAFPGANDFDPTIVTGSVFIDTDGNGIFNGADTLFDPTQNDLSLTAGESVSLVIVSDIPVTAVDGEEGAVTLTAAPTTAFTGTTPGTSAAGAGENGSDAVLGNPTGDASDGGNGAVDGVYQVSALTVTLTKTIDSVLDTFGGATKTPGAVVTYQVVVDVAGTGTAEGLTVTDTIGDGATADLEYVVETVTVGAVAKTDGSDGDEVTVSDPGHGGKLITVTLGDTAAPFTATIQFQAEIK